MRKQLSAALVALFLSLSICQADGVAASTKNPKRGQFCAAKEVGMRVNGLVCGASGSRNRWK